MNMADQSDDHDLLGLVATGDKAAMRVLYERHHDGLFAFIRGKSGDDFTTADVVHDTMLEVWRKAGAFSGRSSVKTWMFTIARNKLVDRFRKSSRVSVVEEVPEMVDEGPDPEAVAIASNDASRVRACLAKLKEAHRAVIRLAFFEDQSYDQIAEIEGIPVGTVKTRVHHAKQLLMRCLGRR